ncbi:MAG: cytochrome D1 domain-containing protein [Rhodospirillales bacterium]|jgi:mono/diheme cytochrome c family protein|nr:cytochrome D1 domain-containing protein [Rhodospirillales bacterium]
MRHVLFICVALIAAWGAAQASERPQVSKAAAADADAAAAPLYQKHCASCHGGDRLGGSGPALLPENLGRLSPEKAAKVTAEGAPASQMRGFGAVLSKAEIAALMGLIYTPLDAIPQWGMAEIEASRVVHNALAGLPQDPVHGADPLNLFTVVEAGDHHVTILDGDRFEPLLRFPSRFALHGGAKYSPDGRFVYLASRDGWVSKFDLYSLKPVAEVRAGINTRNIAVSGDGRYVMVANTLPHTLVVLDAGELAPVRIIPVGDGKGKSSRVSAVYVAPPRMSFIAALKDITEVWEISYSDNPKPVPRGFIHSYEPGHEEGDFDRGPFPVRRIKLDDYLDDFFFDQSYANLIGAARNAKGGQVVNLNVGRKVADVDLAGMPHLGSGITFAYEGKPVLATPHFKDGVVSVIEMRGWTTVRRIETLGPGFFMRSHENTPYAWVDVFFGPHRDALHVIDKRTLEIVKTIRPSPGKTAAHIEFTRDGRFALVSVWERDGALVVYDAATLEEVKRIPMNKPSGKYNVHNKIRYSAGTSH